jgi:hypothetical protein
MAPVIRATSQPGSEVGPENPNPGSEGATTEKASAASPPWARGSASRPMTSWSSTTAGPAVECQQGHGVGLGQAGMDEVDPLAIDGGGELGCRLSLASHARQS